MIKRMNHIALAVMILGLAPDNALAQNESPDSVSRQEYEKLKNDFTAVRARLDSLEQLDADKPIQAPEASSTPSWVDQERTRMRLEALEDLTARLEPGLSDFHLTGFAFTRYTNLEGTDSTFTAVLAPVILWELNDKLLFETELEFELESEGGEGATKVELEYAQLSYILSDTVTLGAGKFLTPFGLFGERLHPAWINKFPNGPLPFGHSGLVPMTSLGVYVRGGFPMGEAKANYALYLSNGPALSTEGHHSGNLEFENFDDINNSKAIGGRFGYLPTPALEIGYSFQFADVAASGFGQEVDALLQGVDVTYVAESDPLGGVVDLRFEWVFSDVDDAIFEDDGVPFTFNNKRDGGYLQLAYRPTMSDVSFVKNLEFVGRYDWLDLPSGALEAFDQDRWSLGVNYWINPSSVMKFSFQHTDFDGAPDMDAFLAQIAIGF